MTLELITKFMLQMAPASSHNPIINVLKGAEKDSINLMIGGFQLLHNDIANDGSLESAAAVNGMLLGIIISYGLQNEPRMKSIIEDYIEQNKKEKGANVVDFTALRMKK